jgi:hypothetical protein
VIHVTIASGRSSGQPLDFNQPQSFTHPQNARKRLDWPRGFANRCDKTVQVADGFDFDASPWDFVPISAAAVDIPLATSNSRKQISLFASSATL